MFLIESVIITISITKCYKYTSITIGVIEIVRIWIKSNSIQSAVNNNFYTDIRGEAHTLIEFNNFSTSKKVGYVNL